MNYEVFIEGENITLCIPNEYAITNDGWASWFNETERLNATGHGVFPNFRESQRERLISLAIDDANISLLVCNLSAEQAFGIVSLQNIDFRARSCDIAFNLNAAARKGLPELAALEVMALASEHGFNYLGVDRIFAGQVADVLANWNKRCEVVGYQTEGVLRRAFRKGHRVSDVFQNVMHHEVFLKLSAHRGGQLWPGNEEVKRLLSLQPKISAAQKLDEALHEIEMTAYSYLYDAIEEKNV